MLFTITEPGLLSWYSGLAMDWKTGVWFLGGDSFSLCFHIQTGSRAHPAYQIGTETPSPEVEWPGHEADIHLVSTLRICDAISALLHISSWHHVYLCIGTTLPLCSMLLKDKIYHYFPPHSVYTHRFWPFVSLDSAGEFTYRNELCTNFK